MVDQLQINLGKRFADFLDDPVYHAAAVFMDAKNFRFKSVDDVYSNVEVLLKHFYHCLRPILVMLKSYLKNSSVFIRMLQHS